VPYVSRGQGHLKVMYDTDEEKAQRGWQPRLPLSRGTNRGTTFSQPVSGSRLARYWEEGPH